jgi:hypothetical protein
MTKDSNPEDSRGRNDGRAPQNPSLDILALGPRAPVIWRVADGSVRASGSPTAARRRLVDILDEALRILDGDDDEEVEEGGQATDPGKSKSK